MTVTDPDNFRRSLRTPFFRAMIVLSCYIALSSRTNIEGTTVSMLRCDPYPGDGLKAEQPGPFHFATLCNNSGFIHSAALASLLGIGARGSP